MFLLRPTEYKYLYNARFVYMFWFIFIELFFEALPKFLKGSIFELNYVNVADLYLIFDVNEDWG